MQEESCNQIALLLLSNI